MSTTYVYVGTARMPVAMIHRPPEAFASPKRWLLTSEAHRNARFKTLKGAKLGARRRWPTCKFALFGPIEST